MALFYTIHPDDVRDETGEIIKWFGTNTDIDERKKAEALVAGENKILEMVATGRPLEETLEELCRIVDDLSHGLRVRTGSRAAEIEIRSSTRQRQFFAAYRCDPALVGSLQLGEAGGPA